jgi:hypothetical protein
LAAPDTAQMRWRFGSPNSWGEIRLLDYIEPPHCRQLYPTYHGRGAGASLDNRTCRPQSSSASRVTAGALGFLTFTQCGHRPDRYGEPSRFDTIPSQPSRQSKLEACRVVHAGDNTPPFRTTHRYALNLTARQIQKAPAPEARASYLGRKILPPTTDGAAP